MSTEQLIQEIVRRAAAGEAVALCTVVSTRGSCPQSPGARMLVLGDRRTLGTLGGGCVEAEVRRRAVEMQNARESGLLEFSLDHDYGWDDGLICGGVMDVYVESIDAAKIGVFQQSLDTLRDGRPAAVRIQYVRDGKAAEFVEKIEPPATLLIAGAGHVGQALAGLAPDLGFDVTILDDRADYVSSERFPTARHRLVGDIEQSLRDQAIGPQTYVVIVTRGHQHDGQALRAVIDSPARYIGLIGSKRKVKAIFDDLAQQGISLERLSRVHAPIGYEIGAVTVPEIAISIAAELIAVKRGRENLPARPMKMDEGQLRDWIRRESKDRTPPP